MTTVGAVTALKRYIGQRRLSVLVLMACDSHPLVGTLMNEPCIIIKRRLSI